MKYIIIAVIYLFAISLVITASANIKRIDEGEFRSTFKMLFGDKEMINAGACYIQSVNKSVTFNDALYYSENIINASRMYGIEPSLMFALIKVESTFYKYARSKAGAAGLGQIIERYHRDTLDRIKRETGLKSIYDVKLNIYASSNILSDYIKMSNGSIRDGLRRYNGSKNYYYSEKVLSEQKNVIKKLESVDYLYGEGVGNVGCN